MTELSKFTIAQARDALRKGDTSSAEITADCLSAIADADALGAFVHHTPDIAKDQAAAADVRIKAGDAPDMCGIPLGIKDLFCTKGVPSQAASRILEGFKPEYESTIASKLFDAGAVIAGKVGRCLCGCNHVVRGQRILCVRQRDFHNLCACVFQHRCAVFPELFDL